MKDHILQILFLASVFLSPKFMFAYTVAQDEYIEHTHEQSVTADQINNAIGQMVEEAVRKAIEKQSKDGQSIKQLQRLLSVVHKQGVHALNPQDYQSVMHGLTDTYRDVITQKVDGHTLLDRSLHRIFHLFDFSMQLMQVAMTVFIATVTWRMISAITGYTISGILFHASGLGLVAGFISSIFGVTTEVAQESDCISQYADTGLWSQVYGVMRSGLWALEIVSTIRWSISLVKNYGPKFIPAAILV